jgi:hypothetical protein
MKPPLTLTAAFFTLAAALIFFFAGYPTIVLWLARATMVLAVITLIRIVTRPRTGSWAVVE